MKYNNDQILKSYDGDWIDGKFHGFGKLIYQKYYIFNNYIGYFENDFF